MGGDSAHYQHKYLFAVEVPEATSNRDYFISRSERLRKAPTRRRIGTNVVCRRLHDRFPACMKPQVTERFEARG